MSDKGTGFAYYPALNWFHEADHPERRERLLTTFDLFEKSGLLDRSDLKLVPSAAASRSAIESVHVCLPEYDEIVEESHKMAAGSVLALADEWKSGGIRNGFAAIRPPGHHIGRITLGCRGFCTINNMAILVHHLRRVHGMKRIAIIDTDVHHGDGTQSIFWNDPDVLFVSIHQDGRTIYPGTGFPAETGGPSALNTTLNLPVPPGSGDAEILRIVDEIVLPVVRDFAPEIVLNSAGQDGHFRDPLGALKLTARGYAELTRRLNPAIVVLEGGYSFETDLPLTHLAMMKALCGDSTDDLKEPGSDRPENPDRMRTQDWIDQLKRDVFNSREASMKPDALNVDTIREKQTIVFYDRSSLYDHQIERYNACNRCSGISTIRSTAHLLDRRDRITSIIVIPFDACPECRVQAMSGTGIQPERDRQIDRTIIQDVQNGVITIRGAG